MRCKGLKNIFQVGNCYSLINTGGKPVKCPMCLGEGKIKTLQEFLAASDATFDEVIEAQKVANEAITKVIDTKTELKGKMNHDNNEKQEAVTEQKTKKEIYSSSSKAKGSKGKK